MTLPVDPSRFVVYLGVMTAMAFFPGPANLFSVAAGMSRGTRPMLAGVAGMNCATLIWYAGAATGLGVLMAAFPRLFWGLRLAGAAYLLVLAVQTLRGAHAGEGETGLASGPRGRSAFVDGFLVQIANPKVLLFFTVVLPPFIDAGRPPAPQFALYAPTTIGVDGLAMIAYGLGGAAFSRWMQRPGFRRSFAVVTAMLLALAAAMVGWSAVSG